MFVSFLSLVSPFLAFAWWRNDTFLTLIFFFLLSSSRLFTLRNMILRVCLSRVMIWASLGFIRCIQHTPLVSSPISDLLFLDAWISGTYFLSSLFSSFYLYCILAFHIFSILFSLLSILICNVCCLICVNLYYLSLLSLFFLCISFWCSPLCQSCRKFTDSPERYFGIKWQRRDRSGGRARAKERERREHPT